MPEINRTALRKLLAEHFSIGELQSLCFDLQEDTEMFAGQTDRNVLSVKIVERFERLDRLHELLDLDPSGLAGAARYFDLAITKCRELLTKTPELYEALYAYGTALAGQAVISDQWSAIGERARLLQPTLETYQRAMGIFAGPTILKNTLRDLGYLRQSAGCEELEPVIQLLERNG